MAKRVLTTGLTVAVGLVVAVGAVYALADGRMLSGVLLALAAAAVLRLSAVAWRRTARD